MADDTTEQTSSVDPTERVLDWRPRHDPRSLSYAVTPAPVPRRIQWRAGPVLDQGREGACVGFGWVAEALATPVRVDTARVRALTPPQWSRDPQALASQVYRQAQRVDPWPGEDYEGTSVLAGAKVMQSLGLVKAYRWALGVQALPAALRYGPVVIGIPWREGMYEAPDGVVDARGRLVGGHCLLVTGYYSDGAPWGPKGERVFMWRNSWGRGYGRGGDAVIRWDDLGALLADDGEACTPSRRSYGR